MDLQRIHNAIDFFYEKSQDGFLAPEVKDARLDEGQLLRFSELFGNPNEYQPGAPVPRMSYGITQKIHDSLLPFKKTQSFISGDFSSGIYTLPGDYMHLLGMEIAISDSDAPGGVRWENVDFTTEDRWAKRKSSQLIPATAQRPIGRFAGISGRAVQLHPAQGYAGNLYYLRRPAAPVFAYSQNGRVITYNQNGSTQLEWDDTETMIIIFKALQLLGVNLRAGDVVQFFQQKDAAGV